MERGEIRAEKERDYQWSCSHLWYLQERGYGSHGVQEIAHLIYH